MDTIDITVMMEAGEGWPLVGALVRFDLSGVVGVSPLDYDACPPWLMDGMRSADALLRAGLPLDRLDALSPVWGYRHESAFYVPLMRTN